MKNYLNKGVLYKEWMALRSVALLYTMTLFIAYIIPFIDFVRALKNSISAGPEYYKDFCLYNSQDFTWILKNDSKTVVILGIVIVIATFVVGMDFQGRKYDVLGSMPFKREEIILGKWIVSSLIVVIPMVLTTISMSLIYLVNKEILTPFITNKIIFKYGIICTLGYLFILTFIMFIQSLSGVNVFGGIIGCILLVFPMGIIVLISEFIRIFTLNPNLAYIEKLCKMTHQLINIVEPYFLPEYVFEGIDKLYLFKTVLMLVGAIIISLILMVYSFKKVPLERSGYLVIFRPMEVIFKIGVSICFGLVGGIISCDMLTSYNDIYGITDKNIQEFLPIINKTITLSVLIAILCGSIVYVITNKIIEINKR